MVYIDGTESEKLWNEMIENDDSRPVIHIEGKVKCHCGYDFLNIVDDIHASPNLNTSPNCFCIAWECQCGQWYQVSADTDIDVMPMKNNISYKDKSICFQKNKIREPISLSQRFEVLKRDKYRCQLCGATAKNGSRLEIDHKIPVSKGGKSDMLNLWTLCFSCNRGKGTKSL